MWPTFGLPRPRNFSRETAPPPPPPRPIGWNGDPTPPEPVPCPTTKRALKRLLPPASHFSLPPSSASRHLPAPLPLRSSHFKENTFFRTAQAHPCPGWEACGGGAGAEARYPAGCLANHVGRAVPRDCKGRRSSILAVSIVGNGLVKVMAPAEILNGKEVST